LFFRTQDDAFYLGSSNVNQHDNVVWNDANGAVLYLQSASDGSTCVFSDIKVIYHRASWHWWDGGRIISMRSTGKGTTISNDHIKNVTVTDPLPAFPPFYATLTDTSVSNVTLNNIVFENNIQKHEGVSTSQDAKNGKPQNTMIGNSHVRWKNITFNCCEYNGITLESFGEGDFDTSFVDVNSINFNNCMITSNENAGFVQETLAQAYIYPNPVDNFIHVNVNDLIELTLFDMMGTKVLSSKFNHISTDKLKTGTYLAKIATSENIFYQKILIR